MLQDFPPEVACVRVAKKRVELEGFDSEKPASPAKLSVNIASMAASVATALVAGAIGVGVVSSWRPAPAVASATYIPQRSSIYLPAEPPAELPSRPIAVIAVTPPSTPKKTAASPSVLPRLRPPVAVVSLPPEAPQVSPLVSVAKAEDLVVATRAVEPQPVVERPQPVAERPVINSAPIRMVIDDSSAIQDVIRRYESAYERLDAAAAKRIWPSVDERALARAFAGLSSQTLTLQPCRIDMTGGSAVASCSGYATYVGKVGNKAGQIQRRAWTFHLERSNDGWQIGSVQSN